VLDKLFSESEKQRMYKLTQAINPRQLADVGPLTNLIFISENILTGYLLFEHEIFKQTGTKNLFELILKAYET
jgi:hypothetical protein